MARNLEAGAVARPKTTLRLSRAHLSKCVITAKVAKGKVGPFSLADVGRFVGIKHSDRWGYARISNVISPTEVEARTFK